jgi:Raf kinase inhibitor-like YbhB/YbcL family protein
MVRRTLVLVALLVLAGCGGGGLEDPARPPSITVKSAAFTEGGSIPTQFTCAGAGTSPPLSWSGVPDTAKSLVLEVQDADSPNDTYVHWLVVNLPPQDGSVAAGGSPPGAERQNSGGKTGWTAPCPPSGTHRYHFQIYALDVGLVTDDDAAGVGNVIDEHLVGWGETVGTASATTSGAGGY